MLFNSFEFLIFLPIVFSIYWLILGKNVKLQNILLLLSSYIFYSFWDYRFLFLLIFSTVLDSYTGIKIHESSKRSKKAWLFLSIGINLGFLGVFKYYNFFISSFADLMLDLGFQVNAWTLSVILPVGISFYTFHGLSYVIDIYKGRITPEKNFVDYAVFVSFFPLLVAGPIERATHLLPQIQRPRHFTFDQGRDGMRLILYGLFKKVVVADSLAQFVDPVFTDPSSYSSSTLFWTSILFAFQIYGDFSGYSDMAIGIAKLFGIELMSNFRFPYFSRDIAEFWRRWHISLSSWFRDYVYIPLGGSRASKLRSIINIFIIFLLSGFWHGANWTFVFWGLIHACLFVPLFIFNVNRKHTTETVGKGGVTLTEVFQMLLCFSLVSFAWIFFRSPTIDFALAYLGRIFSLEGTLLPSFFASSAMFIIPLLVLDWLSRFDERHLFLNLKYRYYLDVTLAIIVFYNLRIGEEQADFIYFQF